MSDGGDLSSLAAELSMQRFPSKYGCGGFSWIGGGVV